ncbi:MAG: malate synthase A [Alphaproteobacteria bacterium]|nr:malate synthase A [Alphaproteobacteria bacterium]
MTSAPVARSAAIRVAQARDTWFDRVLTPEALSFVADLHRVFAPRVQALLEARRAYQARIDAGALPGFDPLTRVIREGEWRVAPIPADLRDRRVEITGPVDRKMIINALNSGANVFMADFEDSSAPTWEQMVEGQMHLQDAVRRTISFEHPTKGTYRLVDDPAVLMVRPRGWHLVEAHLEVDGQAVVAALFDFGMYLFHNHAALAARGTGPYFYLPKLQAASEAELWNDVFVYAQHALGIPQGTIKATVLIETLPAVFQMHEILDALREHAVGLNCGRWDYIFSCIKTLRAKKGHVLPDRRELTMTTRFMRSYTEALIQTCHRRGAFAMGGMAAQIPIKDDPAANEAALGKVRADKLREARAGHDGTWVAHPGLVAIAREAFDSVLTGPNQLDVLRGDVVPAASDFLALPEGTPTEAGLRENLSVGLQYLAHWLDGNGCVPLNHLMEDAATAEISRTQVWMWVQQGARLADGRAIDADLVEALLDEVAAGLRAAGPVPKTFSRALGLFRRLCVEPAFAEFLTLPAYWQLVSP